MIVLLTERQDVISFQKLLRIKETFRHRCGAQSSKLVDGRKVVGRFDSYTFPPSLNKKIRLR